MKVCHTSILILLSYDSVKNERPKTRCIDRTKKGHTPKQDSLRFCLKIIMGLESVSASEECLEDAVGDLAVQCTCKLYMHLYNTLYIHTNNSVDKTSAKLFKVKRKTLQIV